METSANVLCKNAPTEICLLTNTKKIVSEGDKAAGMVNVLLARDHWTQNSPKYVLALRVSCLSLALWPLGNLQSGDTYSKHQSWVVPLLSGSPSGCSSFCASCFCQHSLLFSLSFSNNPFTPGLSTLTFLVSFAICPPSERTWKNNPELTSHLTKEGCSLHLDEEGALRHQVALFGAASFYHEAFKKRRFWASPVVSSK